eukprot:44499_1
MQRITVLSLLFASLMASDQWIAPSSPTLHRGMTNMAIGFYHPYIKLIGGSPSNTQLQQYDIVNNIMIDNGTGGIINDPTFGYGQYYTQSSNDLFIIDSSGDRFSVYHLDTNTFEKDWGGVIFNTAVSAYACLASHQIDQNEMLFVLGAYDTTNHYRNTVQILNITSLSNPQWLSNPPTMRAARGKHACTVHAATNRLYAIGGVDYDTGTGGNIYLLTIEYMDISDMSFTGFQYNSYNLLSAAYGPRAIAHHNHGVYVIGGSGAWDGSSYNYNYYMQVISTRTGIVSSGARFNSFAMSGTAAIMVNDTLYAFGGTNYDISKPYFDSWEYYQVPAPTTINPTSKPTNVPTPAPTMHLSALYIADYNLTLSGSPYHIVSNVEIRNSAKIFVENGVKIIFAGDYTLTLMGDASFGCHNIQNDSIYTHISAISNVVPYGRKAKIEVATLLASGFSASFCNVKFENMNIGLYSSQNQFNPVDYTITNCEFDNLNYAVSDYNNDGLTTTHTIANTYFHNVDYVVHGGGFIFEYCEFQSFGQVFAPSAYGRDTAINHCTFHGDGSQACIAVHSLIGSSSITNNVIDRCGYGIRIPSSYSHEWIEIRNNTISNARLYGIHQHISSNPYNISIVDNTFIYNTGYTIHSEGVANRGTSIEIIDNVFINNTYTLLDYPIQSAHSRCISIGSQTIVRIENNTFQDNSGEDYLISVAATTVSITTNDFGLNTFVRGIIYVYVDQFWLRNNIFHVNHITGFYVSAMTYWGSLISVYGDSSYGTSHVMHNTITNNQIDATSKGGVYFQGGSSLAAFSLMFEYNQITDNKLQSYCCGTVSYSTDILYLTKTPNSIIQHNYFENNFVSNSYATANYIYFDSQEIHFSGDSIIQYNHFNESESIRSYIYYGTTYFRKTMNFNNFHEYHSLLYFAVLNDQYHDLNATFNYYSAFVDVNNISARLEDVCDSINDKFIIFWPWYKSPIDFQNTASPLACSWNVLGCTYQGNGWCETYNPTQQPTKNPTVAPSTNPTTPTQNPSMNPTIYPTQGPTINPSSDPSSHPTLLPSIFPSYSPTESTEDPTNDPTIDPTNDPTIDPTNDPTRQPTIGPTIEPTQPPTVDPTNDPTIDPTNDPTIDPTLQPTIDPTNDPTIDP